MAFKRRALPSAKSEAKFLIETYAIADPFNQWRDLIVENAPSNPSALVLIPIKEVLDVNHSRIGYIWKNLKDATALDRIKALIATINSRRPPYEMYAAEIEIPALGRIILTIIAVIHVDRGNGEVVFQQFLWSGKSETTTL